MSSTITTIFTKDEITEEQLIRACELRIDDLRRLMKESLSSESLLNIPCVPVRARSRDEKYSITTIGAMEISENPRKVYAAARGLFITFWNKAILPTRRDKLQHALCPVLFLRQKNGVKLEHLSVYNAEYHRLNPSLNAVTCTGLEIEHSVQEVLNILKISPEELFFALQQPITEWERKTSERYKIAQKAAEEFRKNSDELQAIIHKRHFVV